MRRFPDNRRLIVCSSRDHRDFVARYRYPEDHVCVSGAALYGIRVTEIIDLRDPDRSQSESEREREQEWWDHAQCRIRPSS